MSASSYANSQGLRLLSAAVQELGPLFTRQVLQPLAARQGLSLGHLSKLLSLLNALGQVAILKRGVYAVQSPLYAGENSPLCDCRRPASAGRHQPLVGAGTSRLHYPTATDGTGNHHDSGHHA